MKLEELINKSNKISFLLGCVIIVIGMVSPSILSIFTTSDINYLSDVWSNSTLSTIEKYKIVFFGSIIYLKLLYLIPFVAFVYLLKQGRHIRSLMKTELEKIKRE